MQLALTNTNVRPTHNRVARVTAWSPFVVLPILTFIVGRTWTGWVWMWSLAGSIYVGCKWLTWRDAIDRGATPTWTRSIVYLLAYPGMDAPRFLGMSTAPHVTPPTITQWLTAIARVLAGAILLLLVARQFVDASLLAAGWIGMVGMILALHFGVFDLLVFACRAGGIDAQRVMIAPARSTSLSAFWGARWNLAFRDLSHRYIFRPLLRRLSPIGATLACFAISGLIHDFVISVPARGGFGLPTAFFMLQGVGVLFERSSLARRIGLGRGVRGWCFVALLTLGPACVLFHRPFVFDVIVPFMRAIRAL